MPKPPLKELWGDLVSDVRHHSKGSPARALYGLLFHPSLQVIVNYRWLRIAKFYLKPLLPFVRMRQFRKHNVLISSEAVLGRRVTFPHPLGIVIGDGVRIGNGVRIYQQVTFGGRGRVIGDAEYPSVGENTTIFAGAKLIGNITVGRDVTVGANAVVTKDVADGETVAGIPAKPIRKGARIQEEAIVEEVR